MLTAVVALALGQNESGEADAGWAMAEGEQSTTDNNIIH